VSLLLHDTCYRTLLLGKGLVLVLMVKRRLLTRVVVKGWVVVERRWELENGGRDLTFLIFNATANARLLA